jgi:Cupin-like domain
MNSAESVIFEPLSTQKGPACEVFAPDEAQRFREEFNKRHYSFRHNLGNHPLFAIPRLVELAERMIKDGHPGRFVAFRATRQSARTKFSQLSIEESLAEKIRRISEGESWLKLAFAQEADPAFGRLHQRIIDEAAALCDYPLRQELGWSSMTILVSSPGVVTPYHIDHESNFLFQIQGEKEIWLFDPTDRRVLSEQEIERYYAGNVHAADYHEGMQFAGNAYRLTPGTGVHNPPLAPHWVKNGENVSVSVSLNFSLLTLETRARVYQANHYIRRLGIRPLPPERSPVRDRLKSRVTTLFTRARPANLDELLHSGAPYIAGRLHTKLSGKPRASPRSDMR